MKVEQLVPQKRSWKARHIKPHLMHFFDMLGEPFIYYRIYPWLSAQGAKRYADLEKRIMPHTVSLETRSICNGRCAFCAASVQNETRPDKHMPYEVFDRVITDLASVNYAGRLAFFVNNEPLLDKRLPDWIVEARKRLPNAYLQVSTNGIKLTGDVAIDLLEKGLDDLSVSDYTSTDYLSDRVAKVIEQMPDKYQGRFFVSLRRIDEKLYNRGGTAPNAPALSSPIPAFCTFPFVQINVVHDGTVSLCCQDLKVQSPMGNIMDSGLWGVWFGETFIRTRKHLLSMSRKENSICAICDYRGFKTLTGAKSLFNPMFTVIK